MAKKPTLPGRYIGLNIKRARADAGITQLALAHKLGYTGEDAGAYVSRVEAGQQTPRVDTLSRIASALNVSLESLLLKPKKV